jgi:folate-binding protein YgfZ
MSAPATHGDVTAEYLAARQGSGLVAMGSELVWVRGTDTVTFLDGLLSQSIESLRPGAVARSLLLSPQGKLRAPLWILRGEAEVGLVADHGFGEQVRQDLARFKIRVDVELAAPAQLVEVWGAGAADMVAAAGLPVPAIGSWERVDGDVVARLALGQTAAERFVIAADRTAALEAAGATPVGALAATTVRVEAGLAVMGVDVDEATIPQEADLVEGAVDFDKGCYLGQELVARIDSRGRVNRRLRGLVIRGAVIPPVGAQVMGADRELGVVTSVGESYELRAPVALAMLHRTAEPESTVALVWEGGSVEAQVSRLPLDPALSGD